MIDQANIAVREALNKKFTGFFALLGYVKFSAAAEAVERLYANSRLAITQATEQGKAIAMQTVRECTDAAYKAGRIDERNSIATLINKDLDDLQFALLKDDISAKELRKLYNDLLPRLHDNFRAALEGKVHEANVQEVQEKEGAEPASE